MVTHTQDRRTCVDINTKLLMAGNARRNEHEMACIYLTTAGPDRVKPVPVAVASKKPATSAAKPKTAASKKAPSGTHHRRPASKMEGPSRMAKRVYVTSMIQQ